MDHWVEVEDGLHLLLLEAVVDYTLAHYSLVLGLEAAVRNLGFGLELDLELDLELGLEVIVARRLLVGKVQLDRTV
jgi:hypothetical protein